MHSHTHIQTRAERCSKITLWTWFTTLVGMIIVACCIFTDKLLKCWRSDFYWGLYHTNTPSYVSYSSWNFYIQPGHVGISVIFQSWFKHSTQTLVLYKMECGDTLQPAATQIKVSTAAWYSRVWVCDFVHECVGICECMSIWVYVCVSEWAAVSRPLGPSGLVRVTAIVMHLFDKNTTWNRFS